jgi:hypothetical protein
MNCFDQNRELARSFESEMLGFVAQLHAERAEMKSKLQEQSECTWHVHTCVSLC